MHYSFDFDYTLADSSEGTVACASYALDNMGRESCAPQTIKKTIGLSLERTFQALTDESSPEAAAAFKALFLAHAEDVMLNHIHFYPHTPGLLIALQAQGHYVSIVSTKLKVRIDEALARDGLTDLVADVVGGGCVQNNKPDPEALHKVIDAAGIAPDQTVYVGDSVSDGECAQRAGVDFIGVGTGTTPRQDLEVWQPILLLDHAGQITEP